MNRLFSVFPRLPHVVNIITARVPGVDGYRLKWAENFDLPPQPLLTATNVGFLDPNVDRSRLSVQALEDQIRIVFDPASYGIPDGIAFWMQFVTVTGGVEGTPGAMTLVLPASFISTTGLIFIAGAPTGTQQLDLPLMRDFTFQCDGDIEIGTEEGGQTFKVPGSATEIHSLSFLGSLATIYVTGGAFSMSARLALGASLEPSNQDGTTIVPTPSIPGQPSVIGTSTEVAHADHRHGLPPFGNVAGTFAEGSDPRLSNDRTASGLRTTSGVVTVSSAVPPTAGQALVASGPTAASWTTVAGGGGGALPQISAWRYVSVDGDDITGDGTIGKPFQTLTAAFASITDATYEKCYGVWVASTLFNEELIAQPPFTFVCGASRDQCILAYSDWTLSDEWDQPSTIGGVSNVSLYPNFQLDFPPIDGGSQFFVTDCNILGTIGVSSQLMDFSQSIVITNCHGGGVSLVGGAGLAVNSTLQDVRVIDSDTGTAPFVPVRWQSIGGTIIRISGGALDPLTQSQIDLTTTVVSQEMQLEGPLFLNANASLLPSSMILTNGVQLNLAGTSPRTIGDETVSRRWTSSKGSPAELGRERFGSPGDLYSNVDGGAGSTLWVKESGVATNTGWVSVRGGVLTVSDAKLMAQGKLSVHATTGGPLVSTAIDVNAAPLGVDTVLLVNGNRVLVLSGTTTDGTNGNGIYLVQSAGTGNDGIWVRAPDADTADKVPVGTTVVVAGGDAFAGSAWRTTGFSQTPPNGPHWLWERVPGPREENALLSSLEGARPSPQAVGAYSEGIPGVGPYYAPYDHVHKALTGFPTTLVPGAVGDVGNAIELASANHRHAMPAYGTTANTFCQGNDLRLGTGAPIALVPGASNSSGSGPGRALADHSHGLPPFGTSSGTFCAGDDPRLTPSGVSSNRAIRFSYLEAGTFPFTVPPGYEVTTIWISAGAGGGGGGTAGGGGATGTNTGGGGGGGRGGSGGSCSLVNVPVAGLGEGLVLTITVGAGGTGGIGGTGPLAGAVGPVGVGGLAGGLSSVADADGIIIATASPANGGPLSVGTAAFGAAAGGTGSTSAATFSPIHWPYTTTYPTLSATPGGGGGANGTSGGGSAKININTLNLQGLGTISNIGTPAVGAGGVGPGGGAGAGGGGGAGSGGAPSYFGWETRLAGPVPKTGPGSGTGGDPGQGGAGGALPVNAGSDGSAGGAGANGSMGRGGGGGAGGGGGGGGSGGAGGGKGGSGGKGGDGSPGCVILELQPLGT